MAFGFLKTQQNAGTTVTTLNITIAAAPVGSLNIVSVKFLNSSVSAITVTDNASVPNTYAKAVGPITVTNSTMYQYYGVQATGGATQVTISWTTASTLRATVDQFSGGKQTNATVFDKAASNTGASGTSGSLTLAPTVAGELIVAAIGWNAAVTAPTAGSNYLITSANTSTNTEYRQVGTTSETAPLSWTTSTAWAEIASAYIPIDTSANFFQVL